MRLLWSLGLTVGLFSMLTSLLPAAPTEAVTAPGEAYADFTSQVVMTIQALGGVTMLGKISLLITLVVSSMKVSVLNDTVWKRLGAAQVWVAPLLGLAAGVAGLGVGGQPVTAALVLTYAAAGGGSVFVHEILDSVKQVPGIGPIYRLLISWIESRLGGQKPVPPAAGVPTIADTIK